MTARKRRCPNGHSVIPQRVVYGMPTPELLTRAATGKVALGGCDPTGGPEFVCPTCHAPMAVRR